MMAPNFHPIISPVKRGIKYNIMVDDLGSNRCKSSAITKEEVIDIAIPMLNEYRSSNNECFILNSLKIDFASTEFHMSSKLIVHIESSRPID